MDLKPRTLQNDVKYWIIIAGLTVAMLGAASTAHAQDLIELYRTERVQAQAAELAQSRGMALTPLAPEHLSVSTDSLFAEAAEDSVAAPVEPPNPFLEASWQAVHHFARGWFDEKFADVKWAYLGNARRSPLDTTVTPELRARLEAQFERPTRTLLDVLREHENEPDEYIQFEYDFVVNDSIPVLVLDTAGPFDRGVVIASDDRYRSLLDELRVGLAAQLFGGKRPAPYTDYYFDAEPRVWYLTGYDGVRYFTQPVKRPNFIRWSLPDIQPSSIAKEKGQQRR
ncbi:MAG TPA: hypothetical protein VFG50_14620 [Rhodothermales bacterium]|nr:hypothetical protein [Rhodothermales bacterium]